MTYLMDTRDEGRRVERKTDRYLTIAQLQWAGLRNGDSVLDLGCAAGTTCRIMSGLVGDTGRVVGVDSSERRLSEGRLHRDHRPNICYRLGDAAHIPAEDAEFDLCWSRFLFEYQQQPHAILSDMIRKTRSGGTVCVSDIDGNCIWHSPYPASLRADVEAALCTLGSHFNARAGLSLFAMFTDAGLQDVSVDIKPYHLIAGSIDVERRAQWEMKLHGVALALRERGWSAKRTARLAGAFLAHLDDHRSMTYSVLVSVRGTVSR